MTHVGCTNGLGGNANDNGNGGTVDAPPVVTIKLTVDQDIPADQPFTVIYDASNSPTSVIAFYDTDGTADSGDEFVFPNVSGLFGGVDQAVLFDTAAVDENGQRIISLGTYHFGIRATNGFGSTTQYAVKEDGTPVNVRINGLPQPSIDSPTSDLVVLSGALGSIDVVFSCNDPEAATDSSEVSWTLFYDTNQVVDDGTSGTIGTGTGNASPGSLTQTVTWSTLGVLEDVYNIGLTCTDSAASVLTAYGSGQVTITTELPIPTIEVTEPADNLLIFGTDQDITIEFSSSDPSDTDAAITVFIDTNDSLGFDETEIELQSGLSASSTSFTINSSIIPNGEYYVGAYIEKDDQRNVDYASGKLIVSGTGDLTVSQPSEPLTITPGTDVTVRWNTNVPNGQGLIDLALYNALGDGTRLDIVTDPDPFAEAKSLEISPSSSILETTFLASGFYVIEVMLTPVDEDDVPTGGPVSTAYSATIRVTTLPNIFWVGSIELAEDQQNNPPLGHFDGIIYEGLQFEDNAGTDLLGVGDIDGETGDDILIGARFAKPIFNNPNGIGIGEAYLIYADSRTNRSNRRFSLNAVGLDTSDPSLPSDDEVDPNSLPGLLFFGIRFDPDSEDINGDGQLTSGCFTEDADGDGKLDQFDEDHDGNGQLTVFAGLTVSYEDVDLDDNLDLNEDGTLWLDVNCDGVADNPLGDSFFVEQFVNGYLDTDITEDRDGDGVLDTAGDDTFGLTSLGLMPDVDGDDLPELAFGFKNTDSGKPGRPTDRAEPNNFGNLVQFNQFERGGIVIVPSSDESTINERGAPGRFNNDRILELDRAGQEFVNLGDEDNTGTGIEGSVPEDRPTDGMDAYPLVADGLNREGPNTCGTTDVTLALVNNTSIGAIAVADITITVTPQDGDPTASTEEIPVVPGTQTLNCQPCTTGDLIQAELNTITLWDPDPALGGNPVDIIPEPDPNEDSASVSCGQTIIFGLVGPKDSDGSYDSFLVCSGDSEEPDNCDTGGIGFDFGCDQAPGQDGCFETIEGPFFGFSYDGLTEGNFQFESPSHPLAYDQTLSNPAWREIEFASLVDPQSCINDCGHVIDDVDFVRGFVGPGGAPPFDSITSGFYPGSITASHGTRILGQAVGDHFGQDISFSPSSDDRVFVSAPQRTVDGQGGAGAVYQWEMMRYWDSPGSVGGWSTIDSSGGVPRPHQYIIKDLGFDTPNNETNTVEGSLKFAITYTGADENDGLGAAILGITDFNGDAKEDLVMGAPLADGANNSAADSGAVYIIYRRPPTVEGQAIDLNDIARDPDTDPNRLNGMLINGDSADQMGQVLAGNCDMNGDETDDVIIGIPHADSDRGEVVIIFGSPNPSADYLPSPTEGYDIQTLVDGGHAVRIQGVSANDQAGFNVICDGDFDGDDQDDLIITAPSATPQYDSNGDDILDTPGLDLNKDGVDDGLLTNPTEAGLMYVILNTPDLSGTLSLSQMGGMLQGFIFAGLKGGDQLGGGTETKRNTRSQGLAYAGDVDADGKDDVLVSSIFADPNGKTNAGEIYLIYGFNEQEAARSLSEEE